MTHSADRSTYSSMFTEFMPVQIFIINIHPKTWSQVDSSKYILLVAGCSTGEKPCLPRVSGLGAWTKPKGQNANQMNFPSRWFLSLKVVLAGSTCIPWWERIGSSLHPGHGQTLHPSPLTLLCQSACCSLTAIQTLKIKITSVCCPGS